MILTKVGKSHFEEYIYDCAITWVKKTHRQSIFFRSAGMTCSYLVLSNRKKSYLNNDSRQKQAINKLSIESIGNNVVRYIDYIMNNRSHAMQ